MTIELKQKINSLYNVTLNRLLSINKVIRDNRKTLSKDNLNYYKLKRKETDQLLSSIKTINDDKVKYDLLKHKYMTFEISDSRF